MEILLDRKIRINEIGPELLAVNREGLSLALNLSSLPPMSLEE